VPNLLQVPQISELGFIEESLKPIFPAELLSLGDSAIELEDKPKSAKVIVRKCSSQLFEFPRNLDPETTELLLDMNQIKSLPLSLQDLTCLQVLTLSHNSIRSVPAVIGFLTNLRVLNLAHNIIDSLPLEFMQLKELTRLDISFNRFKFLRIYY
jgi:Leucine-rich repeat (LRR) protein